MKKNTQKTKKNRFRGFSEEERRLIKAGMEEELSSLYHSAFPVNDNLSWEDSKAKYVNGPAAICEKLIEEIKQC